MDGRGRPREYQVRRGRLSASGTGRGERDQGKRLRGFRRRLHYTVCSLQASVNTAIRKTFSRPTDDTKFS